MQSSTSRTFKTKIAPANTLRQRVGPMGLCVRIVEVSLAIDYEGLKASPPCPGLYKCSRLPCPIHRARLPLCLNYSKIKTSSSWNFRAVHARV